MDKGKKRKEKRNSPQYNTTLLDYTGGVTDGEALDVIARDCPGYLPDRIWTVRKRGAGDHGRGIFPFIQQDFRDYDAFLEGAETYGGSGICGKAAAASVLSYYRDSLGYDRLPSGEKVYLHRGMTRKVDRMYLELSQIYVKLDHDFKRFLGRLYIRKYCKYSYEILGLYELGVALMLARYGYGEEAALFYGNVQAYGPLKFGRLRTLPTRLMKFTFSDFGRHLARAIGMKSLIQGRQASGDLLERALKQHRPAVIGCAWSHNGKQYGSHYFTVVGYYRMRPERRLPLIDSLKRRRTRQLHLSQQEEGILSLRSPRRSREYVEVYDNWSRQSRILRWDHFKKESLYTVDAILPPALERSEADPKPEDQ